MATCQNRAENQTDITGYYDRGPGRGLKQKQKTVVIGRDLKNNGDFV